MAAIENLTDHIKVIRDDNTTNFYEKLDADGNHLLDVSIKAGKLVITTPDTIETFDYSTVTAPASTDIQDLLDSVHLFLVPFIQSQRILYGELSMQDNATATVIVGANTPVLAAGTTVVGELAQFTHTNQRLTYIGALSNTFLVSVSASMNIVSGANLDVTMYVALNGAIVAKSGITRFLATTSDIGTTPLNPLIPMVTGDYIEVWLENNSGTQNIVLIDLNVAVE